MATNANDPIYSFSDAVEYLNFELKNRQRKNPKFSLRAWSNQLGFKNPSYFSHILKKERKLKPPLAKKLSENLRLKGKEKKFFELLVLNGSASSDVEKKVFSKMLVRVRPKEISALEDFPLEKFEMAADWQHWAILEVFYLADHPGTVEEIHEKFSYTLTKKVIKESLERLEGLGFIEKSPEGRYHRVPRGPLFMKEIPSWAIRSYRKAMLEKAKEAADQSPGGQNHLRGTMLALDKEGYEKAVNILIECHKRVLELASAYKGEEVFHMGTQLFPVTKSGEKKLC
ncbi:MAG: TIGR02147 family protein [Oligoflexia bacterium]|nr:TIGR02147 family protein [Oligoflexia bacterium]